MLGRLILLFVGIPLLELVLLLQVGDWIGVFPTLGLVVATGVLGAALARNQGIRAFTAVQERMLQGELPGRALLDGLAVLVGGALLLTPGILTDLVGFSLLVPTTRRWILRAAEKSLDRRVREGQVHIGVLGPDGVYSEGTADIGRWDSPGGEGPGARPF